MTDRLAETRIGERARVWTLGGERLETSYGANCVGIAGRDAVLLVDPLIAPTHARLVEDALRAWTDSPVRFVVLTHHHTDHALGAGWFVSRGATVVAHSACRSAMTREHATLIEARRKMPHLADLFGDAEPYSPSLILENDAWEVDLGGARVRVRHPGPGHTPGDLVAWLEEEDVTICGDLVSAGYHVNYEDADLARLESGLEELWKRRARTYVPGHGAAGGPEVVEAQGDYHRAIARAASVGDVEGGAAKLRHRYPSYKLEELLPQSIDRWRRGKKA